MVRHEHLLVEHMRIFQISPIVIAAALSACAQEPETLNSERIEERFGSYGIEILSQDSDVRRSNLYSVHDEERICRTYAVVKFLEDSTPKIAAAHAEVVAGQSIGSTFKASGWEISKVTLHIGTVLLDDSEHEIKRLMQLKGPVELGVHAYQLVLNQAPQSIEYATIVETHHPDYLSVDELENLYGAGIEASLNEQEIRNLSTLILDMD